MLEKSALSMAGLAITCLLWTLPAHANTLVVGNKGEDNVSFIDLDTGRETGRAEAGAAPHEVAVSPDGRTAAVVAYGANSIHLIDIATREPRGIVDLGVNANPHGIAWLPDDRIVATTEGSDAIIVIGAAQGSDDRAVTAISTRLSAGSERLGSHMLAVSPDLHFTFVANLTAGTVTKIDLVAGRAVAEVATAVGTEGIAVTPDGREVWVSAREADSLIVLDAATMERIATIAVGRFPLRVAISPDGRYAVTSNMRDGTLSVVDIASRQLVRTISVLGGQGEQQVTIIFSPDGSRLYVALTGINKIAEIEFASGTRLGLLSGGGQGDGLAISATSSPPRPAASE